ncbi:MAG: methyl-accepting chemotaxis protein [Thiohalomonadales bacterium]
MLRNMRIGTRLSLGFSLVLIIVLAMIIPIVIMKVSDVVHQTEQSALEDLYQSAIAEINSEGRLAQAMSYIVASDSRIQTAFAEGKRKELASITVPLFKELEKRYSVRQFQFHLAPAVSFLRAHKPNKFGDDLSSFRKTILATNENLKPILGLEKGVAGLGIRGLVPVFNKNKHIGSVEFGMSFGQSFFDSFKEKYGVDIALHVERNGRFETFGSTLGSQSLLNPEQIEQAKNGHSLVGIAEIGNVTYATYGRVVTDYSGNAIGVMEIAMDRTESVTAISDTRNLTLLVGGLALFIGLALSWTIGRSITNPISNAVNAMNDIAKGEGDLTQRLEETGNDEITKLSIAFNLFAEKVHTIITQVSASTSHLTSAAENMSSITRDTSDGVQAQQSETEQVATAMNEMTATVQEVARHANEASSAAQSADDEALNGKNVVEQVVSSISTLADEILNAKTIISQVESDTGDIGTVLEVIRGVAEQTNLLALNAAIEAARAGEQGRGFAVVADEVRTLASRTQQSTQEIQQVIEKLQNGARQAVQAMETSSERSQNSVAQASQAGHSLQAIADAVTTIRDMNIQIANAADEQSRVAEEINKNITNISHVVEQTSVGAKQTLSSSTDLENLAGELTSLVAQFKT